MTIMTGSTRKCVVIDCSHIFLIDYTTTQGFIQILEEFKRFDSKLHFAEVHVSTMNSSGIAIINYISLDQTHP